MRMSLVAGAVAARLSSHRVSLGPNFWSDAKLPLPTLLVTLLFVVFLIACPRATDLGTSATLLIAYPPAVGEGEGSTRLRRVPTRVRATMPSLGLVYHASGWLHPHTAR